MPPGRFLSDAEIERLEVWPEAIERRDVVRFFAPAGEDLEFVREQLGAANQVAVALQSAKMGSMHEAEKEASHIDIKAAGINAEAAEIAKLVADRGREARSPLQMDKLFSSDDRPDRQRAQLLLQIESSEKISQEVRCVREAAQRIQDLAQGIRRSVGETSLI
jgi:hypothetical protein